jgi:ribosomal protein S18 acetylase RimI-like enzyme
MINQSENYIIRMAINQDVDSCANIHKQEINGGFLSQLGLKFLKLLYKAIISSSNTCCIVAEKDNFVVGFVAISFNTNKFYKEFFIKYGLKVFFILIFNLFNPVIMKKVIESAIYPFKKIKTKKNDSIEITETELLSIAVNQNAKGTGIAQRLIETMFDECKKRNIRKIKVIVGAENSRANRFYEKVGFRFCSNIYIHGSDVSNVYIKELN